MAEDLLDLICLLDFDTDTNRVDGRFYIDTFVLVSRDGQGVQEHLLRGSEIYDKS